MVRARLVEIVDGTFVGESRSARLIFEAPSLGTRVAFELARPGNLPVDSIAGAFPLGTEAILYLITRQVDPSTQNVPDHPLWWLITPQGFIFRRPDGLIRPYDPLGDLGDPFGDLDDWLPTGGERTGVAPAPEPVTTAGRVIDAVPARPSTPTSTCERGVDPPAVRITPGGGWPYEYRGALIDEDMAEVVIRWQGAGLFARLAGADVCFYVSSVGNSGVSLAVLDDLATARAVVDETVDSDVAARIRVIDADDASDWTWSPIAWMFDPDHP